MILEKVIEEIHGIIKEALTYFEYGSIKVDYDITQPPIPEFGDYSTNVSFQLAKIMRKSPFLIAEEIVKNKLGMCYKWQTRRYIESTNYEKPGFINFVLNKKAFLQEFLQNDIEKATIVTSENFKQNNNDTIIIEHTSVNPNKALHVGHLRNAIIGDCLYRIFRKIGNEVKILNYIDDSGLQVADIIVGFKYAGMPAEDWKSASINYSKFDQYCGNEIYVKINELYKQRPELLENRTSVIRELEDPMSEISTFTNRIVNKVLIDQLKTTWDIKIHYDLLNFESQIVQSNLWYQLFENLKEKHIVKYESEGKNKGCWIYSSEKEGDKVLIRSDTTLTYFAKDIPYAAWKLGFLKNPFMYKTFAKQWDFTYLYSTTLQQRHNNSEYEHQNLNDNDRFAINFDKISRVITIIDSRQERLQTLMVEILTKLGISSSRYKYLGYEPVILSKNTMALLGVETINNKAAHMSGRKGIFVEADLALSMLDEKAKKETKKRNPDLPEKELRRISREIAISAIRYYFIKHDLGKIITFDINDSLSLEGDTAPYIQYAYARGKKIEEKLRNTRRQIEFLKPLRNFEFKFTNVEIDLVKHLCKYTIELNESSEKANPKILAKYLYQLATLFNNFYETSRIISESNVDLALARFIILRNSLMVFEACMELIGVSSLGNM